MAEVEFRDGKREIPDHLADLMVGMDTYKLTYAQAENEANQKLARDVLWKFQQQTIDAHFKRR